MHSFVNRAVFFVFSVFPLQPSHRPWNEPDCSAGGFQGLFVTASHQAGVKATSEWALGVKWTLYKSQQVVTRVRRHCCVNINTVLLSDCGTGGKESAVETFCNVLHMILILLLLPLSFFTSSVLPRSGRWTCMFTVCVHCFPEGMIINSTACWLLYICMEGQ